MRVYYPRNKIKAGLKTDGDRFLLDGKYYKGEYYETYDGKFFTGKNPFQPGGNQPLQDASTASGNTAQHGDVQPLGIIPIDSTTIAITPYYPKPTEQDYEQGYFFRYFIKKVNETSGITEINKQTYDHFSASNKLPFSTIYQVEDILWQLTGPLYTSRLNGRYTVAGIIDTNKRIVETTDKTFRGLKTYIGEQYDKFSRPK